MPQDYYLGYYFYAPRGKFEACGMFSASHIISASICFIAAVICALIFIKKSNASLRRIYKTTAISLSVLEAIKILHSFIYGDLYLDAWFPLSYCGLLIFAAWFAGFGSSYFKTAGETFIAYGCPIAGIIFLIFPTTSLMSFPIWHYFSLYSMLFHGLMIFLGIVQLNAEKSLDLKRYLSYAFFVALFSIISIILNSIYNCNLMNLREPYNVPVELIQSVYSYSECAYTLMVISVYAIIPIVSGFFSNKLFINKSKTILPKG